MDWTFTLGAGAGLLLLLILAGRMHAQRGIGRLSFVPWDYVMILAAIFLIMLAAHGAILWRDGWPLPWEAAATGI